MYCTRCGTANPEGAEIRFCRFCGAELERVASEPAVAEAQPGAADVAAPVELPPAAAPASASSQAVDAGIPAQIQITASPYGGFWVRLGAYLVDSVILAAVGYVALFAVGAAVAIVLAAGGVEPNVMVMVTALVAMLAGFLVSLAYYVVLTPLAGATPGKLLLGFHVVAEDGRHVGFTRALFRWLGYIVSGLAFGLGFVWIGIDERKQGWHDKIAGTYVVRKELVKP